MSGPAPMECARCQYLGASADPTLTTVLDGQGVCTIHIAYLRSAPVFDTGGFVCSTCIFITALDRPGTGDAFTVYAGNALCVEHAAVINNALKVGGVAH
jgi:hypothetical protein